LRDALPGVDTEFLASEVSVLEKTRPTSTATVVAVMSILVVTITVLIIVVIAILRRRATDAGYHGDNEQEKSD
jgi:lysylphosphatidylglycerol synthetase-like protein (DUF2156 family)